MDRMNESRTKRILFLNYTAGAPVSGIGEDDAAMTLAPHVLKSYLMRNGRRDLDIEIKVVNPGEHQENTLKAIHAFKPDIAGFSCFVWNLSNTIDLSRKLSLIHPETDIILGGPEVSDIGFSVHLMTKYPWIHSIIRGEAEIPLEKYINSRIDRATIEGLTYRSNGLIMANEGLPIFRDLDTIPSVYTPEFVGQYPVVYYSTSRGCVGRCRYCREWSIKRDLSISRIEEDLSVIFKHGRMKIFCFIDSVLDDNMDRLNGILDITTRLNKKRVPISGYFYFRNADDRLFDKLEKAGFKYLRIGIESQKGDILKRVGRSAKNLSRIDKALRHADRFTIVPYIITHLPGETSHSFREHLKSCFRMGLLQLDFHCNWLDIYPGTDLHKHAEREGYIYDTYPPHHVFASKYWPYAQFINDKRFVRNMMALGRIFLPRDEAFLSFNGINLFEIADSINSAYPEWKDAYSYLSSDSISDIAISENISDLFSGYVDKTFKRKIDREALSRLFKLRHSCFLAKRTQDSYVRYKPFRGDITADSVFFLPYYACMQGGLDVTAAESCANTLFDDLPRTDDTICIIGRMPRGFHFIRTGKEVPVESFLSILRNNHQQMLPLSHLFGQTPQQWREEFVSLLFKLRAHCSLLAPESARRLVVGNRGNTVRI
jgi:radical SAM superfamily enzyme YgiQ (UPF0313 family)